MNGVLYTRTSLIETFYIAALALLILSLCVVTSTTASASTLGIFEPRLLKGIDTVLVSYEILPEYSLLPKETSSPETRGTISLNLLPAVKALFAKSPWITVRATEDMTHADRSRPNVLVLVYAISTQRATINGNTLSVGSLGLQIQKHDSAKQYTAIAVVPATYPFVVPDTSALLGSTVDKGVRYLTSYLPGYIACANKYGHPSNACPDCSISACKLERPFQAHLPMHCPPPTSGQTVPTPCVLAE